MKKQILIMERLRTRRKIFKNHLMFEVMVRRGFKIVSDFQIGANPLPDKIAEDEPGVFGA